MATLRLDQCGSEKEINDLLNQLNDLEDFFHQYNDHTPNKPLREVFVAIMYLTRRIREYSVEGIKRELDTIKKALPNAVQAVHSLKFMPVEETLNRLQKQGERFLAVSEKFKRFEKAYQKFGFGEEVEFLKKLQKIEALTNIPEKELQYHVDRYENEILTLNLAKNTLQKLIVECRKAGLNGTAKDLEKKWKTFRQIRENPAELQHSLKYYSQLAEEIQKNLKSRSLNPKQSGFSDLDWIKKATDVLRDSTGTKEKDLNKSPNLRKQ